MNQKFSTSSLLKLTTIIVGLCSLFVFSQVSAYVGEEVGINMYNDLDKGYSKLYDKLITKALKGNVEKINTATLGIGKCKQSKGCFEKDFTIGELEAIQSGASDISVITKHLKDKKYVPNDADFMSMKQTIVTLYSQLKTETSSNQQNLGEISLIGLYTDGSLDNSSFDLAYDVEQIHKVIFSEAIPYNGFENQSARGMLDLFAGIFDNNNSADSNPTTPTNQVTGSGGGGTSAGSGTSGNNTTASGTTSLLASCNPTDLANLDSGFYTDIANQVNDGGNTSSSTSGQVGDSNTTSNNGVPSSDTNAPSSSRSTPRNNKLTDSFPCNTFFCIRVNMLIYQQKLFGGGKSFAVESILDQNLKIANKYAGNYMGSSKMTKNFFSLGQNINFGSRLHIGVMVTQLPVPLLNVEKSGGDKLQKKSKETPSEILKRVFSDYGINIKQQNNLYPAAIANKTAIQGSAGLDTSEFIQKQKTLDSTLNTILQGKYTTIATNQFRSDYYAAFNNDLVELRTFSSALRNNIDNIIDIIKAMYAKK